MDLQEVLEQNSTHLSSNMRVYRTTGTLYVISIIVQSGLSTRSLSTWTSQLTKGEGGSYCHGSIIDGRFEGFIQTQKGRYYIEPIERYDQGDNPIIHSFIYHQDDIDSSLLQGQGPHCMNESMFGVLRRHQQGLREPAIQELVLSRSQRSVDHSRTTCLLHLHADHLYYQRMGSNESVTAQIANYLKAVNEIYEKVNFEGIRHINFKVKELSIDSEYDRTNPLHARFISMEKLLILHSKGNWSEYCLSYLLSDRDYSGMLGVAWQGNLGDSGGICSRSLNTGLITLQKYGSQVPLRLVHITLAHELGHSLGSPHDEGEECIPPESSNSQRNAGNFLMFPYASDGHEYNNDKLSPCTIRHISKILRAKKDRCFEDSKRPICGNQIVEEGEECDVGHSTTDPCCYGASQSIDVSCRLKPGKQCSPTQGPCCGPQCVPGPSHQQCRKEAECAFESHCDGMATTCPDPPPKANYTLCNHGMRLCLDGQCSESLCAQHGLEQCSCVSQSIEEECHLCCQTPGDPGTCTSSASVLLHEYFNSTLLSLPPGSPCKKKQGYCDRFNICRLVDDDGPIAKLRNAIFDPKEFEGISEWMKTSWGQSYKPLKRRGQTNVIRLQERRGASRAVRPPPPQGPPPRNIGPFLNTVTLTVLWHRKYCQQ
ncbi:disintegrin and metalloproteinase domain-containing protein 10 isoform X3 [Heptranchias perlo]|uniref:disintegrin and metalloproteinase domain-containing protein 10 isoform X3 n=1 Tax=Heptranchias perlo TaxID=212740 RepID=UPI0035598273